jgi:hypothetical protein
MDKQTIQCGTTKPAVCYGMSESVDRKYGPLTCGLWVQGLVAMSGALELMYTALANNQVPQQWAQVSYPSLKPLGAWLKDLQARFAFFASWLRRGVPACFWLAAFFFPQVFIWTLNACC